MIWRPTGRSSTKPAGIEIAGLPTMFAGMVERAVVAQPDLASGHAGVGLNLSGKRHIRVGRADHEVDLVEHVGHGLVGGGASGFCPTRHGEVQVAVRELDAEGHRPGEVVLASGPPVAELVAQGREVAYRPLGPELWQLDHRVDHLEPDLAGQRLAHLLHQCGDLVARRSRFPGPD